VVHKVYLWARHRDKPRETTNPVAWLILVAINFNLVCVTWVFFRAETFDKAMAILARIADHAPGLPVPWLFPAVLIPGLLLVQAVQARTSIIDQLLKRPRLSRFVMYFGIVLMIAVISSSQPVDFIYFVF
jgi:hypothetical protein